MAVDGEYSASHPLDIGLYLGDLAGTDHPDVVDAVREGPPFDLVQPFGLVGVERDDQLADVRVRDARSVQNSFRRTEPRRQSRAFRDPGG